MTPRLQIKSRAAMALAMQWQAMVSFNRIACDQQHERTHMKRLATLALLAASPTARRRIMNDV